MKISALFCLLTYNCLEPDSSLDAQLQQDGALDLSHVVRRERAQARSEPLFAGRGQLVSHRLAGLTIQLNQGFARIDAANLGRDGNDQCSVERCIRCIIADDDSRAGLLNLTPDRWIEGDPVHITAFQAHPQSAIQTTPLPRLRAHYRMPSAGSHRAVHPSPGAPSQTRLSGRRPRSLWEQ